MVIGLIEVMVFVMMLLFIVFVVLVLIWVFQPSERRTPRQKTREDLRKIKEQVNGARS